MKILILSLLALVFSANVNAQTFVSGGIYQNTNWTVNNSPYVVTGPVVVFPGNTLTIAPGVQIIVNNTVNDSIYIETRGTLNMMGTDQLPISIRTQIDTTNIGWLGFICTSSQGGVLNANRFSISNAQTPFDYETPLALYSYTNCSFNHCGQAITVGNETVLNNCQFRGNNAAVYGWSYFTLNNCFFKDNGTAINAYATAFTMTNSSFVENNTGLTFSAGVFDSMYIDNCIFQNNGTALSNPNNGKIENCIFLDNATGIQSSYGCKISNNVFNYNEVAVDVSVLTELVNNQINNNIGGVRISGISSVVNAPIVTNNEICGNINYNVNNNTNVNYSLLTNCFCGLDSAGIELSIIDGYDDVTKGLINYQIFDTSCTILLGTVLKFNQVAGVAANEMQDFTFENPVENTLTLLSTTVINEIALCDLNGKVLVMKAFAANAFNVSDLRPGFFILKRVNQTPVNQKFIIY
jgi:hypothetical protein